MHGTQYCAVPCDLEHMRTIDFELILCVKITSCMACRQVGINVMFVIDLPARHHSHFFLAQGKSRRQKEEWEGGDGEGME